MAYFRIVNKRDKVDTLDNLLMKYGGVLQANTRHNKMIIAPHLLNGYVMINQYNKQ